MSRHAVWLFVSICLLHSANAEVVVDSNISLTSSSSFFDYGFYIGQDADNIEITCNPFSWNDGNVTGNYCLDEGAEWFIVQEGDELSTCTVGSPSTVNFPDESFPDAQFPRFFDSQLSLNAGEEFFVGVATPIADDYRTFPPTFGWVKLRVTGNSPQNLEMVSNAITYCGKGIYVGTDQIVPEPNAILLTLLAFGSLAMCRRS